MISTPKALVLLDGSDRSLNTVDYICHVPMFQSMRIVLYYVFSNVPEGYWDLQKEPSSIRAYNELRAWEKHKREEIEAYMEYSRRRLSKAGFSRDAIEIKIQNRQKGIARDILEEARAGYEVLVLRRRGMGQLEGMSMGSVATKILTKLTFLPLQVAGRKDWNNKILIGVDGSPHAAQTVDFVSKHIGSGDYCVCLVHVIRGFGNVNAENFKFMVSEKDVEAAKEDIQKHFGQLKEKLVTAGVKPENVTDKIITGSYSRAGSLVKEADCGNFSTIVLGRRGHSVVKEFFMGRVCQKVVQAGRYHTVWIV